MINISTIEIIPHKIPLEERNLGSKSLLYIAFVSLMFFYSEGKFSKAMEEQMPEANKQTSINRPLGALMVLFPCFAILTYVFTVKQTDASGCPIVIDLNGNDRIDIVGHTTTQEKLYTLFSIGTYVTFDIFDNGELEEIDWVKANTDAILVDVREWNSGKPFTGRHLFGTVGVDTKGNQINFENGFMKLALLDENSDGLVSGLETENLRLWKDDGDAFPKESELFELSSENITSISTRFKTEPRAYGADVIFAHATLSTGETLYVEDIWFMSPSDVSDVYVTAGRFFDWFGL